MKSRLGEGASEMENSFMKIFIMKKKHREPIKVLHFDRDFLLNCEIEDSVEVLCIKHCSDGTWYIHILSHIPHLCFMKNYEWACRVSTTTGVIFTWKENDCNLKRLLWHFHKIFRFYAQLRFHFNFNHVPLSLKFLMSFFGKHFLSLTRIFIYTDFCPRS